MASWPFLVLLAVFVGAAAMVWVAGIKLSDTTDVLATRLGLGEALGGLILLAIATNLQRSSPVQRPFRSCPPGSRPCGWVTTSWR